MADASGMILEIVTTCIPYAVAFWVARTLIKIFLGAAFKGRIDV